MIPALIADTLIIAFLIYAIFYAGRAVWRCIVDRREPEPETYGDEGGHPYREIPLKLTPDQKRRARVVIERMRAG